MAQGGFSSATAKLMAHILFCKDIKNRIYMSSTTSRVWINAFMSAGTVTFSLIDNCNVHNSDSLLVPQVKSWPCPWLMVNLSICKASISSALWLWWGDIVSFAKEKKHSHGTAEPWMDRKSKAAANKVGKCSWFSSKNMSKHELWMWLRVWDLPASTGCYSYWSAHLGDMPKLHPPGCALK